MLKKENSLNSGKHALAKIIYQTAKYNIQDAYLKDLIQETIEVYRDTINSREAFAFLYGTMKLSYQKQTVYFAKREYEKWYKLDKRDLSYLKSIK